MLRLEILYWSHLPYTETTEFMENRFNFISNMLVCVQVPWLYWLSVQINVKKKHCVFSVNWQWPLTCPVALCPYRSQKYSKILSFSHLTIVFKSWKFTASFLSLLPSKRWAVPVIVTQAQIWQRIGSLASGGRWLAVGCLGIAPLVETVRRGLKGWS